MRYRMLNTSISSMLSILTFLSLVFLSLPFQGSGFSLKNDFFKSLSYRNRAPKVLYSGSKVKDDFTNTNAKTQTTMKDFATLRKLLNRVDALLQQETSFMRLFWNEELKCFSLNPQVKTTRVSITTTCFALSGILNNPESWKTVVAWEHADNSNIGNRFKISLKDVCKALDPALDSSNDPFQLPVLISTLCSLRALDTEDPRYSNAVERLLEQRSRLSLHRQQNTSSYLRYQNTRALLSIVDTDLVPSKVQCTQRIGYSLERSNLVGFDELCRQIAFYRCGDSANFDPIVLTYSFLIYWETSNNIFLNSFARGVFPAINLKLCAAALQIIFESQANDGTWAKGEPIFSNGNARTRDMGNNYIFFFDLLGEILDKVSDRHPELLAPYLSQIELSLRWAEENILEEMLPEQCDEVSGRCYGEVVKGWRSNHLGNGGPVAWCTSLVFSGLAAMRKLLQKLITDDILTEFSGRRALPSTHRDWNNLMDADLVLGVDFKTTLKKEIYPRLLQPQVEKESSIKVAFQKVARSDTDPSLSLSSNPPVYSLILFGSPGTAKTTICTSMASYLGWAFVTIDTACFLADGLENIASRMVYIFDRLKALKRTVILFDEIEEFCLNRENEQIGMESRLLTTAMLTQLNELRRQQSCIFIVATNRLRSFDAAVTRPGRFDMLLFVGTPNLSARIARFSNKLLNTRLTASEREVASSLVYDYMESRWDTLRFLTFAENEALLNFCVERAIRGELTRNAISGITSTILRTATIQGPVKDDYIASEVLSRV